MKNKFYKELVELHNLWYLIGSLDQKFSSIAEERKEDLRVEFFSLSDKIINKLIKYFEDDLPIFAENLRDEQDVFMKLDEQKLPKRGWRSFKERKKSFFSDIELHINIIKQMEDSLERLYTARDSNNVNRRMEAVSLSLNVMHYNSKIITQFGVTDWELDEISSLPTEALDEQVARYFNPQETY